MQQLNLPPFNYRLKHSEKGIMIFDAFRNKFVSLQPEEWVRQHICHWLVNEKHYAKGRIGLEKQFNINGMQRRFDICVYNASGSPFLLVECKAPQVQISQKTFDQIARYNFIVNAPLLMVSNGITHYFCKINFREQRYDFLNHLPPYQ